MPLIKNMHLCKQTFGRTVLIYPLILYEVKGVKSRQLLLEIMYFHLTCMSKLYVLAWMILPCWIMLELI